MVNKSKAKESKLVGLLITNLNSSIKTTLLITPTAEYRISDGRLLDVKPVINYEEAVKGALKTIGKKILTESLDKTYHIQFFAK